MNRKGHLTIGFVFTIPFIVSNIVMLCLGNVEPWLWWMIPKYVLMWFLFSLGPDMDFAFKVQHRNWFFHSLIIPVIFTICFWGIKGTSFCLIPWSVHLLCDVFQEPGKKPVGSFCISTGKGERLTGRQTKQWLRIQGLGGLVLACLFDIIPMVV